MERDFLVIYRCQGSTLSLRMPGTVSYQDFKDTLRNKGLPEASIQCNIHYTVSPYPACPVTNDEEWNNMIFHMEAVSTYVVSVRASNFAASVCSVAMPSSSAAPTSCGNELAICNEEVLTTQTLNNEKILSLGPQIDVPQKEKKNLLTAPWAFYIEGVGQQFPGSVTELRSKLVKYSIEKGRKFKFVHNTKKQVIAECAYREQYSCPWYLNATYVKHNNYFETRVFRPTHTCSIQIRNHKCLSAIMITNLIVDMLKQNPALKSRTVVGLFETEYGIDISYKQASRGIESARDLIYGRVDDSYEELKLQLHTLKEVNSGSQIEFESHLVTDTEKDETKNRFARSFTSFQAAVEGFAHCRPFLSIDGTHLSGKYEGILLSATAKDGDNGLFPLAFAIVDSENKINWKWFIDQVLRLIPPSRKVIALFKDEFSDITHFYCLHHLKMNLRAQFVGSSYKLSFKEAAANKLSECARAPTPLIFNQKLEELRKFGAAIINNFLQDLPLEKWAFAFAPCDRFGELTSNASESYNNWIKVPRQLPITQCVDMIRSLTMELFYKRRTEAATWQTTFCPEYQAHWDAALYEGRSWHVQGASKHVFEFLCEPSVSVNLLERTCDCYGLQFSGFPCKHGVVALYLAKLTDQLHDYIDDYYFVEAFAQSYEGIIYPVTTMRKLTHSVDIGEKVFPPNTKRQPGRPKKAGFCQSVSRQQKDNISAAGAEVSGTLLVYAAHQFVAVEQ